MKDAINDIISLAEVRMKELKKNKNKIIVSAIVLVFSVAVFNAVSICMTKVNNFEIHFIDVGQGDSTLIRTPNRNMLIDTGPNSSEDIVRRYLKNLRIKNIDILICTHHDEDHIGNTDFIIDNFKVGYLLIPNTKDRGIDFANMISSAKRRNTKVLTSKSGDSFMLDKNTKINILSPDRYYDNKNKNSIISLIRYGQSRFLVTGDAEKENEAYVLKNYNIGKLDILKAGHHGSKTATSDELVSKTRPSVSIISCGYRNRYSHPHEETIFTLKKYSSNIIRTDVNGNIVFYSDGKNVYSKKKYKTE